MKRALTLMTLAMLALGATTGLLVGLSASPVVSVALPLLFSVLGGAGGFFALKTDFRQDGPVHSVVAYSLSVLAIAVGTAGGAIGGMTLRQPQESWSLLGSANDDLLPATVRDESALDWVLLDARLKGLGLSSAERLLLMKRFDLDAVGGDVVAVAPALESAAAELRAALPTSDQVTTLSEWLDIAGEASRLSKLATTLPAGAESFLADQIASGLSDLSYLEDEAADLEYLAQNTKAADAVASLEAVISLARFAADSKRTPLELLHDRLDEFERGAGSTAIQMFDPGRYLASDQNSALDLSDLIIGS